MKPAEFIAESLALATCAHLRHLSTTSYAEHMALGSFYEALPGLVDSYAEVYQGLKGLIKKYPEVSCGELDLEEYLESLPEVDCCDSPALENIVAEIETLVAQTIYKLRFLD
jgi:Family of unknown function (DUF5856)